MSRRLSSLAGALGALSFAAPAQAIYFGAPVDVEGSGFVLVRGAGATCGAALIAPDLLLTASACIGSAEVQHPELLGWFMGTVDSDRNPIREVAIDNFSPFALLRLTQPLASKGFPLYGGQAEALDQLRCYGFGPRSPLELFSYGLDLSYADYRVVRRDAQSLVLDPPPVVNGLDNGGACFRAGTHEIAAMFANGNIAPIDDARASISEYRATFEVVAEASGLCLANVPNATRVHQVPCITDGLVGRVDQRWNLRRIGRFFQIRSTRFPDFCLGVPPGNSADGAPVLFYPCPPPEVHGYFPTDLVTQPVGEQVWAIQSSGGDSIYLYNNFSGKCLDVPGGSRLPFTRLQQSTCRRGAPNQSFLINVDRFEGGTHRLASFADADTCADVAGALFADGTPVIGWPCHGQENQQFELHQEGATHFQRIARPVSFPMTDQMCLDVPNTFAPSAPLTQRTCRAGGIQQWLFRWLPDDIGYRLHPLHNFAQCTTWPIGSRPGASLVDEACVADLRGAAIWSQRWILE